jgi:tetratricopeptide (TPR) repeat protein
MEHVERGDSLLLQDRYAEAVAEYQQTTEPEAQAHLSLCYLHLGNTAEARKTLEAALSLAPTHPSLLFAKGKLLFYSQDFAAAKEVFASLGEVGASWARKCELQSS